MQHDYVILLHGLGETSLHMLPLGIALRNAGYHTLIPDYPSTVRTTEDAAENCIGAFLGEIPEEVTLHFITHSMGSHLLRYYLQEHGTLAERIGRVVMLGPPNHGAPVFNIYRHFPLLRSLLGPAVQQGAVGEDCLPCQLPEPIGVETGIIAGCVPLDPTSWFVTPWPHDGRTTVRGTRLQGMKDHAMLPSSHEGMPFNPLVIYYTLHFLRYGAFPSFWPRRETAALDKAG